MKDPRKKFLILLIIVVILYLIGVVGFYALFPAPLFPEPSGPADLGYREEYREVCENEIGFKV